jgi:uncharacterized protein (UPF0333 family)
MERAKKTFSLLLPRRGQAILEYVLLLVIIVTLSAFILAKMVSRDEEEPGFLIRHWHEVATQIGQDQAHKR